MAENNINGPFDSTPGNATGNGGATPVGIASKESNFQKPELGIDWKRAINIVQKYFWIVILTSAIGLGLAYFVTKRQTPLFKTYSTIVISSQLPSYLGSQLKSSLSDITEDYWYEKRYLETQYQIIKSRKLSLMVANRLKNKDIMKILGLYKKVKREPTKKEIERCGLIIRSLINVMPLSDSRIIQISIINKDPAMAQLLANKVAETYIDENLERRLHSTRSASTWLDKQLKGLRTKLDNSEKALYKFKLNNNIMDVSLEQRMTSVSSIIHTRIDLVEQNETAARVLKYQIRQFRNLRQKNPTSDAAADFLKSDLIQSLRGKYYATRQKLESLKVEFLEKNPRTLQQEKVVQLSKNQMKTELDLIERSLVAQYKAAKNNLDDTKKRLAKARADALQLGKLEISYKKIKRERDETSKLYELVLARLKETGLAEELKTNNIRMLDKALKPGRPFKPVLVLNLALGLAVGLFIGILLLVLFYYLDNTLKSQDDIEHYLHASFLGHVPLLPYHKLNTPEYDMYVHHHPRSPVAEAVRSIRTNILFMSPDKQIKTMVVTSSSPLEGKTTLSSYLAISVASGGQKTLLIDADMRKPRIHKAFSLKPKAGLSSLIVGKCTFEEAIHSTEVPNLSVLPCGPIPPNPAELQQSKQFDHVFEELLERFDRIIIDSPPIGMVADPAIMGQKVDGVVVVTKYGQTTRHMLKNAYAILSKVKVNILGGIMNYVDVNRWGSKPYYYAKGKKGKYGYYQSYSYGYYGEDDDKPQEKKDKKDKTEKSHKNKKS